MDWLGLQAAEKAAEAQIASIGTGGGGSVRVPGGIYLMGNGSLIFPTGPTNDISTAISLIGDDEYQTTFKSNVDLGPGMYAISCGEPTGDYSNQRGIYGNSGGGLFCQGDFKDFSLITTNYTNLTYGYRPTISSVPIAMNGIRWGARRNHFNVQVEGFNYGEDGQGDHLEFHNVRTPNNFIGWRLDDPLTNLYYDLSAIEFNSYTNAWADMSVSPLATLNIIINKGEIGYAPYGFWLEPGTISGGLGAGAVAITASSLNSINMESIGCGLIVDGNVISTGNNKLRGFLGLGLDNDDTFYSSGAAPAGGCNFLGYINTLTAYDLTISNANGASWPPVSTAPLLYADYIMTSTNSNVHGVLMTGGGVSQIAQAYASNNSEIYECYGGYNGNCGYGMWAGIRLDAGSWQGSIELYDIGDTSVLGAGTIMELSGALGGSQNEIRKAGTTENGTAGLAMAIGVVPYGYSASMEGKFIVVAERGNQLPVIVQSAQSSGGLIKPSSSATSSTWGTGVADSAISLYTFGQITKNDSSSLVHIKR